MSTPPVRLPRMAAEHVAATAAAVFAVLAQPSSHAAIDGTGWVDAAVDRAPLTSVGQVFRMAMHHGDHPDGDHRIANRVEVCDRPRAIAWRPGTEEADGSLSVAGWTWRDDLRPAAAGTEVTLTYDWSEAPAHVRSYLAFPPFPPEHLPRSLRHLAALVTGG